MPLQKSHSVTWPTGILYPESFSSNLLGTHVEMAALAELLRRKLPQLAEHLEKMQCDISIISTDYFLCLFCTTLPSEVRAHVFACLRESSLRMFALFERLKPSLTAVLNCMQTAMRVWDPLLYEGATWPPCISSVR